MKLIQKYIVFTLAMLITLSASGASISLHTCCGKIESFSLMGPSKPCKMAKKELKKDVALKVSSKKCCDNKQVTIKKTSEATYKTQVSDKKNFDVLFVLNFVRSWFGVNQPDEDSEDADSAPSWRFPDSLTVLFRQFRL